ncbi:hypothetical protein E0L36_09235 [Streptomyces sp. AJS327]|uniref:hypothetical protein n=1 Tax=Streptomyces sp. AJS327 TaxID=2545265 RepID=UPI0015DE16C1|nr:hypothetical protein [Streptomyces sp. AJS327]MBA0051069.1 hypothetical protein [Streptomyces sp. AJS327]
MPLHVPQPPAAALHAVRAALATGAGRGGGPATTDPPRVGSALAVHELTGIARQAGPPSTTLTGWRFLLHEPGAPDGTGAGSAEAVPAADGWICAGFSGGPYTASALRALRQAEALASAAPAGGRCEPRLLSVPELYMVTLWLRGGEQSPEPPAERTGPAPSDLLIPLAPTPPGLVAHQPQRASALLPRLSRRLTAARLQSTPA